VFDRQHKIELAYNYHLKYTLLKEAIDGDEHQRKIATADWIEKFNQQRSKVDLLDHDNKIKQQQLESESFKKWVFATSLAVIVLLGLVFFRNLSLKRKNEKLKLKHRAELDSLKTRFFDNISHEFRTPITLILGPLKEMYNGTSKEDPKTVLGPVIRNGQRLLRLINQLLDLSKVEAGKMVLQTTQVDLVQFLKEIASSYESLAANKRIKYFFYPEVQELMVYIDPEKIEKAVHNLLSNALKFTKEGEVILYLKVEDNYAVINVKDTGIGISAMELDKVFDRFYQVDSSQTRGYEGSGLGMALAKELVELHHGKISVESKEGKGTTFTVWLPLGTEHLSKGEITDSKGLKKSKMFSEEQIIPEDTSVVETETEKTTLSSGHPVVLVVEDNTDMRTYIRKTLAEYYHIVEAETGKVGVKKAEEIIPDLIISDIMMPEMDGYQLCERIKNNEPTSHIPVILLTAKADQQSRLTGLEYQADDYLSKPFDADELRLIVRNHIEERRKMRERFSREITLEPAQISVSSLDEKFLQKVLALIEAHMEDENFSIEEFSHEAGYSRMQFYRKIKALAGQTPSQFVRTIRLKRAAQLLNKKSDNVTQIAYCVGFSSLAYFNKCFKEQYDVTPGQYSVEKKV
jgi:signal transduction histidine kinase/DNA-binding response OmpR family regulator